MAKHQSKIGQDSVGGIDWSGKKILDIGCGNGELSLNILEITRADSLVGIDYNQDKIKKANLAAQDQKAEFFVGDATNLVQFKDNIFDVIFSNIAFQQFADKKASLAEMYRPLKPNGVAIVNFVEEKSEVRQEMEKLALTKPFERVINKETFGKNSKKISKTGFDQLAKDVGFRIESESKEHIYYFPDIDSLFRTYSDLAVSFPQLAKLNKEEIDLFWHKLRIVFENKKTAEGYGDIWQVVFAKLIK